MAKHSRPEEQNGLVVNNKRPKDERTLYPGHQLQQKVWSVNKGAEISGSVCEKLTVKILGGHRSTINSTADVCPDTVNEEKRIYVESKACQTAHAFKVPVAQLQHYRRVRFDSYRFNDPYGVLYALWAYSATRITGLSAKHAKNPEPKNPRTLREVIEKVIESVERVFVLDLSLMYRLFRRADKERVKYCSIKDYASWKGYHEPTYHVLNVGHKFLKGLYENTEGVLTEFGLRPEEWRWKATEREFETIVIDGVEFESPPFKCFELVRPEGWYEYPKYPYDAKYSPDPEVPF